ncbi:hypothetical protein RCH05_004050 [Janthinobacterium sp. CAN_S7]
MRSKLVLIVIVIIGMFALNEVAQNGLKNIGQSAIEKSQPQR